MRKVWRCKLERSVDKHTNLYMSRYNHSKLTNKQTNKKETTDTKAKGVQPQRNSTASFMKILMYCQQRIMQQQNAPQIA